MQFIVKLLLFISMFSAVFARAADTDMPRIKVSTHDLKIPGGSAKAVVQDTGGEPISAGFRISLEITCAKDKVKQIVLHELEACAYDLVRYNVKTASVEVLYHVSQMENGRVACNKPVTRAQLVACSK